MPSFKGLTVHVTDDKGNRLAEYGIQHLRQHAKGERVSTYIQSNTGVQFHVSVQPRIPFVNAQNPESETEAWMTDNDDQDIHKSRRRCLGSKDQDRPSAQLRAGSEDRSSGLQREHTSQKAVPSSPIPRSRDGNRVPKYSFLASLYLDGRRNPERRIIVYTNPADSDFTHPDGKVSFRHRWVQSKDGTMTEHAWVFKEKAIETVFDRLMIASSQARSEGHGEDEIIQAMQSSGLGREEDFGVEKGQVGQIIVEIRRVVLGAKKFDRNYRSKHQEGQDDDIDMDRIKADITHATGFAYKSTIAPSPLRIVEYEDYKKGEGLWASFQFFYRSGEQLQRFGFPGFQSKPKAARTGRLLNARMANLTPLSIVQPLASKLKKTTTDEESYENKVKKRTFKADDSRLKPDFGSDYRDPSADDELEVEDSHRYPAASLPFFVPKAPNIGPQRDVSLPGLPTLDPSDVSAVASTFTAATILVDLKLPKAKSNEGATTPHIPFSATNNISFDQSVSLPNDTPFLATPTSLTAEQGSSPPSLTTLSKGNVSKFNLNNNNKTHYRISSTAHTHHESDGDEDADADDELNTESDLETHAGDDESHYAANPEEEDEGYDNLRSQFKNVGIRKRTHAQVDDAEEEVNDVESKADGAATVGGCDDDDGGEHRNTLVPPLLTEEEKENVRLGKKARIEQVAQSMDSHVQSGTDDAVAGTNDTTMMSERIISKKLSYDRLV